VFSEQFDLMSTPPRASGMSLSCPIAFEVPSRRMLAVVLGLPWPQRCNTTVSRLLAKSRPLGLCRHPSVGSASGAWCARTLTCVRPALAADSMHSTRLPAARRPQVCVCERVCVRPYTCAHTPACLLMSVPAHSVYASLCLVVFAHCVHVLTSWTPDKCMQSLIPRTWNS